MSNEQQRNIEMMIKCLKITESESDGEALAAIRKANTFRKKAGFSWEDVISLRGAQSAPRRQEPPRRSGWTTQYREPPEKTEQEKQAEQEAFRRHTEMMNNLFRRAMNNNAGDYSFFSGVDLNGG